MSFASAAAAKLASALVFSALLSGCFCPGAGNRRQEADPNISVFASFIRSVAKQRGVTVPEAADMLYDVGVRGFDAWAGDAGLTELAATRLKPINLYFFPDMFAADNGASGCKSCLDTAVKFGVRQVMVVPTDFTKGGDREKEFAKVLSSMKMFVEEGRRRGITITVEDFGGNANPGSYSKYLKRLLDEVPGLCFALDSGNLYYAGRGESILDMMEYARGRIVHVHLKDQRPDDNRKYETLGLGAVPNEKIVKSLAAAGYGGWYTLENAVGDVYTDTIRQVAVLKFWLRTCGDRPR